MKPQAIRAGSHFQSTISNVAKYLINSNGEKNFVDCHIASLPLAFKNFCKVFFRSLSTDPDRLSLYKKDFFVLVRGNVIL